MISLLTNMHQYYVQADGIPQYIIMLEDAQKKAKRAGMPIAYIELVMMALAATLAAQHFPREVNDLEGLPLSSRTWAAWKTAFRLAHLKHHHQILALGGGEPLGRAHGVLPAAAPAIVRLESVLDNLALAATNDTAILQQLTAANLALTAMVMLLTATNKKIVDAGTRKGKPVVTPAVTPGRGGHAKRNTFPGNYYWTHGHCICKEHTSATCTHQAIGHRLQIPRVAARRTRAGMRRAPDRGGWRMLSIALLMICVKIIFIMLYPHLLAAIPITFHHPTLALLTPAPVEFTSCPPHPWPISIPRLPPSESEWQTASRRGLLLAQPLLLSHPSHLQRCRDM